MDQSNIDNQTDEAMGWAAEGKKLAVDIPEVSFRDAATFVAEMTPIVGDAMAAKEVYDELQKDEPNYYLAGALGGAALIGLIPGVGDIAAKAIKKGAKEVFDVAKRVEVDPNAMGSGLGNIKLKPKDLNYGIATTKADLGFPPRGAYDYDLTMQMEDIIDEWASGDLSNTALRKKLGTIDIKIDGSIKKSDNPSTLSIVMPDGKMFDGTPDVPGLPQVLPPAENSARTQIAGTLPTYKKADTLLTELSGEGKTLDFGAGLGLSKKELGFDTYEPFPKADFTPDFSNPSDIPSNSYNKVTNLNVLNVVPRDVRDTIVQDIGRILEPNGRAVITTRGRDVMAAKGKAGPEPMSIITSSDTYQKGFTQPELRSYITDTLGDGFAVTNNKLGAAGVTVHKLPTQNFNEGGIAMDDQTVRAFALGGLAEDIDPVSGNEVPVGSTPEEVRDDIPAQLSEGEYVVPADVVRFFGVKFFEDIRIKAKQGFAQMESNGRVGGEPMGMEMGDDELPFDVSELQMIDDGAPEQPMMNKGGYMRGYEEGGYIVPSYNPNTEAPSTIEMREYTGPNGDTIFVQFMNGKPLMQIPAGYTTTWTDPNVVASPTAPIVAEVSPVTSKNESSGESSGAVRAAEEEARKNKTSYDWKSGTSSKVNAEGERETVTLDAADYASHYAQMNSGMTKAMQFLPTLLVPGAGLIISSLIKKETQKEQANMLAGIDAKLADNSIANKDQWQALKDGILKDTEEKKKGGTNKDWLEGKVKSAASWLGDITGVTDGELGINSDERKEKQQKKAEAEKAEADATAAAASGASVAVQQPPSNNSGYTGGQSPAAMAAASAAAATADQNSQGVINNAIASGATSSQVANIKKEADKVKSSLKNIAAGGSGGFNKGGLMQKKKRKKK